MTPDVLFKQVAELADAVVSDARFERDDLSVSVLGMLLYGYALGTGSLFFLLDMSDIDAVVLRVLTEKIGAAAKWSGGLVDEANASAFDKEHHPRHHELIGVGHSYMGVDDQEMLVDNVFANIAKLRLRAE